MTRKTCAETHTSDDSTETKIRDMWKRIKYAVDKKGQMKNFESITKIKESVLYDNILKINTQDAEFTDLTVDEMYRISEYFGVNFNYFTTDYYDKKEEEENSAYPMYSQMHKIMSWLTPEQQENVRSHITSYL